MTQHMQAEQTEGGPADVLQSVTFSGDDLGTLPYKTIRATLKQRLMIRIRGLFNPDEIRRLKEAMAAHFDQRHDHKHDPRDTEAIRQNFQKLQVGGISGVGQYQPIGRFLRIFYNPIFADDIYAMRKHFIRLAQLRNHLYGLPRDFAVYGTEHGLWTAARIHQYPRGGGFMSPHRDARTQVIATDAGLFYAQPFLILSKKGEDYSAGGAFIASQHEQQVYYEDWCEPGDVIVYDGRSIHGVGDVDPLLPLDLETFTGRIVAFASLFRHLRPGGEEYEVLAKKAQQYFGPSDNGSL